RADTLSARHTSVRGVRDERYRPRGCPVGHGGVLAGQAHRAPPSHVCMTGSARMTPTLQLVSERCTSRGVRGVVSSAAPQAAPIGLQAFRDGGNAFDAALRAALAETVLVP